MVKKLIFEIIEYTVQIDNNFLEIKVKRKDSDVLNQKKKELVTNRNLSLTTLAQYLLDYDKSFYFNGMKALFKVISETKPPKNPGQQEFSSSQKISELVWQIEQTYCSSNLEELTTETIKKMNFIISS